MTPSEGNSLRAYVLRFLTQWVAVDPCPQPSRLDTWDGAR